MPVALKAEKKKNISSFKNLNILLQACLVVYNK